MSRLQSVKVFVCQRLTAAVEEIIDHLESTMTEYEEEMECRRHRKLLDSVSKREGKLQTADVQLHLLIQEEQQDLRPSLDQEDPVRPHIKEEQEDFWTSQEVKSQLPALQEDTSELPFTPVPVKSENDQEKPQSLPPHQSQTDKDREAEPSASSSAEHMETDADGEDGGGSEPDRGRENFVGERLTKGF
ncbi:hypothetical protein VZT92_004615 [Zoarces viviparus]|uniref:Uncharacterized protein n=1 Tax=Zoarces viviparus TaxID=48416 RepID=A0AAW1G0H1_ZOAVI